MQAGEEGVLEGEDALLGEGALHVVVRAYRVLLQHLHREYVLRVPVVRQHDLLNGLVGSN